MTTLAVLHARSVFQAQGVPAFYTPPAGGAPQPCRVLVTVQPLRYPGGVDLPADGLMVDVLASAVTAQIGGTLTIGGIDHILDIAPLPLPAALDPHGLRRRLLLGWGVPLAFASASGTGMDQHPPQGEGFVTAGPAAAGAGTLAITAPFAAGRLLPGDTVTVDGSTHTVTAPVPVVSGRTATLAITPPLPRPLPAGTPVTLAFPAGQPLRGALVEDAAGEAGGGVRTHRRRLVVPAAGLGHRPQAGDTVRVDGGPPEPVHRATLASVNGQPVLWQLELAA